MKRILICMTVVVMALFCTGCRNTLSPQNISSADKERIAMKEYTVDELYVDGKYQDTYRSPACDRMCIYPNAGFTFIYFSNWSSIFTKEDGTIATLEAPFCYDPLCTHNDVSCLTYSSSASSQLVGYDGKVYMLTQGLAEKIFSVYDLSSGKHEILEQFPEGGRIITRLGRFIYFWIQQVTENSENPYGKQETVRLTYRYDIHSKKIDYLGERSSGISYRKAVSYRGAIYYLGDDNHLWTCDYNIQNFRKVISKQISTYEIVNGKIYYLTLNDSGYGTLYCRELSADADEVLYEGVTWFCIDKETLYYSLYSPIDGFEWDIWQNNEEGKRVLQTYTITVNHGNMIYTIPLDKGGSKGTAIAFCDDFIDKKLYFGEAYAVNNGMLFAQFKESYVDGKSKGMTTGMIVVDIETENMCKTNTEVVMN